MRDARPTTTPETEIETTADEICPLSRQELRGMLRSPLRAMDVVLGDRRRLAMNVAAEHRLPTLALVLVTATALAALPFGAVLGPARAWRVAVLLLGGLAICLPSLQVFGRYLGARFSWQQTLSVALTATATAALFTFAFAPVVGFLRLTMTDAAIVTARCVASVLLFVAVLAGVGQLFRLLRGEAALRARGPSLALVMIPWLGLYLLITARLADVLGLL
jgi:hypothetical protein